jgi:CubicO group peptidase (beta-lactamase class C family)
MSLAVLLDGFTAARLAAAVVGPDGVRDAAGPLDAPVELASVTKLLVACTTLVAVEDGTLDLDQPAGPEGSTLRHLLAHASGLDATTPRVLTAPGTRRIYSNQGFEVIGELLVAATGLPLDVLVHESVLEPLGMTATTLGASAATGAVGTVGDLARFAADLMAPSPTILAPATRDVMVSVAFPGLPGVLPGFGRHDDNTWGLGFELRGAKTPHWTPDAASPRTFGHFGRSGSLLWVDPTVPVALVSLADRPFGDWAPPIWRRLGEATLELARAGEKAASRQEQGSGADGEVLWSTQE